MVLRSKVKVFLRLPAAVKMLFVEALFTSLWVKITLKFFRFRRILGWLGAANRESRTEADDSTLAKRLQIKRALVLCNRYALWPTECYTISLTGKLLLKRRNIDSSLYIGFRRDENGVFKGHAWLRANDTYISGWNEATGYIVHSTFS